MGSEREDVEEMALGKVSKMVGGMCVRTDCILDDRARKDGSRRDGVEVR